MIMKLDLQQITSITRGAMRVAEEADGFHFFRFTESEQEIYVGTKFESRSFTPAGVEMIFDTDATALGIGLSVSEGSSRDYFACDVCAGGEYLGSVKNYEDSSLLCGYAGKKGRQYGDFEGAFELGQGTKRVRVVLPWSAICVVRWLTLDGATTLVPVKSERKILFYGDSITHGYDALLPSRSYTSRLAESLGCEGFNKGIGGERFHPALSEVDCGVEADIVVIAYGTNDWNGADADTFRANCEGFLRNVCARQKRAKIFVITPIWRRDEFEPVRQFGPFSSVEPMMRDVCADLPVTVIRGYDLVPHETENFGDTKLHPNHRGFCHYHDNLLAEIKKSL